jgi:hypothetical protein
MYNLLLNDPKYKQLENYLFPIYTSQLVRNLRVLNEQDLALKSKHYVRLYNLDT